MRFAPTVRHLSHGALAIAAIMATYVSEPAINDAVRGFLGVGQALAPGSKAFALWPFSVFLTIRTLWYLAGFAVVGRLIRRRIVRCEATPALCVVLTINGIVTGTAVMVAVIVVIAAFNGGDIGYVQPDTPHALLITLGWIGCSLVGAAAEEVLYRGMILMALERIGGLRFAVVGSALAFAFSHLGNPGASNLWLLRLFVQGLLLAYAVTRTGSLWWSVGYHAGWNFASAPLLGAVESGYVAEGHLFTFVAAGPAWLTGGDVGPEGSVLAFLAIAAAAASLSATTSHPPGPSEHSALRQRTP